VKIWIINNTKFGYKNNSKEWSNNMFDYFDNEFLPLLTKQYKSDDIVVHLGNVFNNSENLNTKILNRTIDLFERISNICTLYLMVGHNDRVNDNNINTFKALEKHKNIEIVKDCLNLIHKDKKIKLISWCNNPLKHMTSDINLVNIELLKIDERLLKKGKIYCGYYDDKKLLGNCTLVGSPYQFNDSNDKGIYIIDVENNKDIFISNKKSPVYKTIEINEIEEIEVIDEDFVNKNNVNILINKKLIETKEIKTKILLSKYNFKKIDYFDSGTEEIEELSDNTSTTIEKMIRDKIKNSDNKILLSEFENIIKIYKDKY